jgi:hypothetical protein
MSVYHGEDLFVMADGIVLAGSKSCELDISADVLEKAPQTNGQWREFLPGRKSWQLVTNHLLLNENAGMPVVVECKPDGSSVMTLDGVTYTSSADLTMYRFHGAPTKTTYTNNASGQSDFGDDFTNPGRTSFVVLVGKNFDFTDLVDVIDSSFPSFYGDLGTGDLSNKNFILIGHYYNEAVLVIAENNTLPLNLGVLLNIAPALQMDKFIKSTRIRPFAQMVGQTFKLSLQAQKYALDRLQGAAICRRFKVTATKGNLMQGSFEWIGTGPLT